MTSSLRSSLTLSVLVRPSSLIPSHSISLLNLVCLNLLGISHQPRKIHLTIQHSRPTLLNNITRH